MYESDIQTAFFKCTNWQLEETLDPDHCPYHYYCNSTYPGNYNSIIDLLVLIFTFLSFFITIIFMAVEIVRRRIKQSRRYLLPSGPISLPIMILIMAKGYRINSLFPVMSTGPAVLQLIRISAIAFEIESVSDIKYVFLESSTISGILHAALYLDSAVLPFYTGLDALVLSRLSGECESCVCRDRALMVGGRVVVFRGWSVTTAMVAGCLCLRIVCRVWPENSRKASFLKVVLENLSWMLIAAESVYLVIVPRTRLTWVGEASYAGVFVLLCLHIVRKACALLYRRHESGDEKGRL